MRRVRVLLDANVIVDAQARDFFLTAAEAELIDVRWSESIIDEATRALIGRLGLEEKAVHRLVGALERAFPHARSVGFDHLIDTIETPDPDDRHVAAAAVHEECDLLVTENVRDFPNDSLDRFDVLVASVDDAVAYVVGIAPEPLALHRRVPEATEPACADGCGPARCRLGHGGGPAHPLRHRRLGRV